MLSLASDSNPGRFVIANVDVYRMVRNRTVTVSEGTIVELEPAAGKPGGMTLLPGLIDFYVHISNEASLEQAAALGVTTELDMWGDPKTLIPLKRALAADFRTAGTGATVPGGHPTEFGVPMPVLKPGEDAEVCRRPLARRFGLSEDHV